MTSRLVASIFGGTIGCAIAGATPFALLNVLPPDHPISSKIASTLGPHLALYNHNIWTKGEERPNRIILLRHGQTHGYSHTCDCQVAGLPVCALKSEVQRPLTQEGRIQAIQAGQALKRVIGSESVVFYTSPYKSCRQTVQFLTSSFRDQDCEIIEDPRLRNIDHGNWNLNTPPEKLEEYKQQADKVGKFYYRWPGGESTANVYDRVCSILETIYRKWQVPGRPENYVFVTHNVVAHCFLMRWFHWDVSTFERLQKFKNGNVVIMEKQDDGSYKLVTPLPALPPIPQGVKRLASSTQ